MNTATPMSSPRRARSPPKVRAPKATTTMKIALRPTNSHAVLRPATPMRLTVTRKHQPTKAASHGICGVHAVFSLPSASSTTIPSAAIAAQTLSRLNDWSDGMNSCGRTRATKTRSRVPAIATRGGVANVVPGSAYSAAVAWVRVAVTPERCSDGAQSGFSA